MPFGITPHRFRIRTPLLLVGLSALACGPSPSGKGPEKVTAIHTDGLGRSVALPERPERIISLAPSVTELLFLLGAGDRVIGVTAHCTWPEGAGRKPRIGTLLHPNYEVVLDSRPDLVIASTAGNDRAAVLKLADLGLPLFISAPRNVESIFETVESVGRIIGSRVEAAELVAGMNRRLSEVSRRLEGLPPTRAFFITWYDPLLSPGKETFENDVLRLAGVDSITSEVEEFYPRYSLEQVLARDPEVLISVAHEGKPLPDLTRIPGWRDLRAVKAGRVLIVGEELQHPSPRFVDGVEELARKLHPERFR